MSFMVNIVMFGSLLVTPLLFLLMPVRRAMVTAYCLLWMFLPVAAIKLPGLPNLTKPAAISLGVLIALVLFYLDLIIRRFRLQWFDIPVIFFGLIAPFVAAMVNGLGVKAGMYELIQSLFLWVVPYFAGRVILGDEMGVQEIATGIFLAALIYAPLAWFEMFFSPQLHRIFYGYHTHKFGQSKRGWGYRPVIFMQHGIMTTTWLVAGAVCGAWLLRNKRLRWNFPLKPHYAVFFLIGTAAVSNSMGALMLMIIAFTILFLMRRINPAWVMVPLLAVAPVYMVGRSTGVLDTEEMTALVRPLSEKRAKSFWYRMWSEEHYVAKAMERPILGWGGEGRQRPIDPETGQEIGASDGLWIIVFGKMGLVGLLSMMFTLLLIPIIAVTKQPKSVWRHPRFAGSAVLIILLCMYMIDCLLNAMVNPIYMLAAGALAGFVTQPLGRRFAAPRRVQRQPQPKRDQPADQPVGIAV